MQSDRHEGRQTERKADRLRARQSDRPPDRQIDEQTDSQTVHGDRIATFLSMTHLFTIASFDH